MTFATWAYSTTLYIILNDTFQALIAFIVPISFKEINCFYDNIVLALYDALTFLNAMSDVISPFLAGVMTLSRVTLLLEPLIRCG